MNKLIQLFCAALLFFSCNQTGFKEVQYVEQMYMGDTTGLNVEVIADTSYFLVSDEYVIEKTFQSTYVVKGSHYEVTTTYPGIAGDQTPVTTYYYDDEPEPTAKIQTGWNVYRTVADSFCLFIDTSFKVSKKSMKDLSAHIYISLDKIDLSKYKRLPNNKYESQEVEVYVAEARGGAPYDSTVLVFNLKINNRLINIHDYPRGKHFVQFQSFNNIQRGNKIISNKQVDFSFTQKDITGSDEQIAKKLIKLYKDNY